MLIGSRSVHIIYDLQQSFNWPIYNPYEFFASVVAFKRSKLHKLKDIVYGVINYLLREIPPQVFL